MKKLFALLLVATFAVAMTNCSSKKAEPIPVDSTALEVDTTTVAVDSVDTVKVQ